MPDRSFQHLNFADNRFKAILEAFNEMVELERLMKNNPASLDGDRHGRLQQHYKMHRQNEAQLLAYQQLELRLDDIQNKKTEHEQQRAEITASQANRWWVNTLFIAVAITLMFFIPFTTLIVGIIAFAGLMYYRSKQDQALNQHQTEHDRLAEQESQIIRDMFNVKPEPVQTLTTAQQVARVEHAVAESVCRAEIDQPVRAAVQNQNAVVGTLVAAQSMFPAPTAAQRRDATVNTIFGDSNSALIR